MFNKLRNKLILINLSITTIILLTAFSTIYLISTHSANERHPIPDTSINFMSDDFNDIIELTVRHEKEEAAKNLLISLIISGIAIEFSVIIVSYFLAEEAIKPVKAAYESQKIFIANASHEIKTPLAAISANLEAADIDDNKWLKNVQLETEKLTALNNELLSLARTDIVTTTSTSEVDLRSEIETIIKSHSARLKNKSLSTKINIPGRVKTNSTDLLQIFSILLDNAIKYSAKKISVVITPHELLVENDGTTISKDNLPHIFDRFYQQDKTSDGVGLGLSIAKSLSDRNNWKLTATSDKTTTFKLSF